MANSPSGCPTASTLATHFGTSTRTIKTDLALIRDQLYLELRWDQGSKTYHLAPGSRVPTWTS
jgi:predicted DNA-binding transcriptional regulator YafY